jgi:hypothetical protein
MGFRLGPGTKGILLAAFTGQWRGSRAPLAQAHRQLVAKLACSTHIRECCRSLGNWFAAHNQFECAVETFRGALKADPQSAQLHYLEGAGARQRIWPAGSGNSTRTGIAIRLQPDVIKPHLFLATISTQQYRSCRLKQMTQWRQALAIDPHSEIASGGSEQRPSCSQRLHAA